ncbi:MAG: hypothetical protein LKG37_01890 [Acetobacter sp.]|nr:hypothetical protein [Acetobacter sp.]MCI1412740.1 hypothetical protein [Acetobacter sp.]
MPALPVEANGIARAPKGPARKDRGRAVTFFPFRLRGRWMREAVAPFLTGEQVETAAAKEGSSSGQPGWTAFVGTTGP